MNELPWTSLANLSSLLASGETTSRAIVDACLDTIATTDGKLHAFIDVYRDDARTLADAADLARATGLTRGPLHGLPIALKDLLEIDGRQTTAGSKSWLGRKSDHTATAVDRLLAAGMIPLGKTHMVEFAFGGWGRNEPMGAPWNPWDPATHRVAGGSSSGSAVAVASGMVPAAIGSDTGGSIRIPSALCGLTGLKPTFGLISLYGAVPLSTIFDSLGPLAHSVADIALLTDAMSGPDPHDQATLAVPQVNCAAALAGAIDVRGMRITAQAVEQFPAYLSSDVRRSRDEAIAVLRDLGANVDEARVPFDFDAYASRLGMLLAAEAYSYHRAYAEDAAVPIDPWVRKRMLAGKNVTAADFVEAVTAVRRAQAEFAAWMQGRDALLTPTLPITAVPVADVDEATAPLAAFTRPVNYLGGCGLSLPAGFSSAGLPIGVQLIGAAFTEPTLIRLGRAFQEVTDWHRQRPPRAAHREAEASPT
jgi:aspartyl-tRNA(Asn)/glutamyl-tRNA(Gln) amidotransferase subunit A